MRSSKDKYEETVFVAISFPFGMIVSYTVSPLKS